MAPMASRMSLNPLIWLLIHVGLLQLVDFWIELNVPKRPCEFRLKTMIGVFEESKRRRMKPRVRLVSVLVKAVSEVQLPPVSRRKYEIVAAVRTATATCPAPLTARLADWNALAVPTDTG